MAKAKVFMIMPFKDAFFEVYEMLRREFENDFEFSNAADEGNQQNILKDIIQPIFEADIIIADLTDLNPNVLYELGVAHTFNKKTIIITQDDLGQLPFDLKQYRAKGYTTHFKKFAELLEYMKTNLVGAVSGDVVYSNPVKDFLVLSGISNISWFSDERIPIDLDDSEKGFIDFLADIEQDAATLTDNINEMGTEINTMTDGINQVTTSIKRVNNSGGSSIAAFVKNGARKAARYIADFSAQLKDHNKQFVEIWNRVEKNTLGLLESPYASKDENKAGLVDFIKTLKSVQSSIVESSESVKSMKASSLDNLGIQRTLNQSICFLDEDLKTYLEIMENMARSIDKIIGKSKFIVGEIDFNDVDIQDEIESVDDTDVRSDSQ